MDILSKQIPEELASRARSLETLGLHEVAWTKKDALEVLAQLAGRTVAVLGGDVYFVSSGRPKPAYENWSCERRPGEALGAYAERSQREAVVFLHTYPDSTDTLFVLVLSMDVTAGL